MKRLIIIAALAAFAICPRAFGAESAVAERITKTFTVAKNGDLDVSVSGGDIRLVAWGKNEVTVVAEGIREDDKDELKMTQEGSTVHVDFHPRWNSSHDVKFTISLPSQFNADVHTAGGDIDVEGVITGTLKGATAGGDIRTGAIEGPTTLKTSGGDITLGKINGETDVKTSGGDIRIASVAKNLNAMTSGGDVEVGDIGGEATLRTAGGSIRAGKVSGKASLKTSGGNITLASASGPTDAMTAGGNVVLKKITGSINAKTAGGNIDAELIPSGNSQSDLKTAAGNVILSLPSNAKATVEATIQMRGSRRYKGDNEFKIRSDFEAESKQSEDEYGNLRSVYKINGGGELITVQTSAGSIEIRKMK